MNLNNFEILNFDKYKMDINEFKKNVEILETNKSYSLRNRYINKFIDTSSEEYDKNINTLNRYSDGKCYDGYLWDYINNPTVIDIEYINKYSNKLNQVLVLWDIHTEERILVKDYWKFDKDSVIKLNFKVLLSNLSYLPEDIYIFDERFDWTFVLTHEYIDNSRWCLKSGRV